VRLSESLGDSAGLGESVRWLAVALEAQGHRDEAAAQWRRVFEVSSAIGDSVGVGNALGAFAYDSLTAGRFEGARRRYEEAIAVLAAAGALGAELNARLGLARVLEQLGEYDRTRASLRELAARADSAHYGYVQANAWNNLGGLEYALGDPGEAADCFRRAVEIHDADGSVLPALTSRVNLAITQSALGRYAEAESLLSAALEASRREELPAQEAQARAELGDLEAARGRWQAALAQYDAGLALGARLEPTDVADLAIGEARARIALDDVARGARDLDRHCLPLRSTFTPELRLALDALRAELQIRLGEPQATLEIVRITEEEAGSDIPRLRLPLLVLAARAERMRGRQERAAADLRDALAIWEADRRVPLDPEWRAQRTSAGRALFAELLSMHVDEAAAAAVSEADAAAAFDLLQRFKARTLRERMRRPDPSTPRADAAGESATLADVRAALTQSELLLDAFVGPDASYVFAVTRTGCRVTVLPGERELAPRVQLLVDFVGTPTATERPAETVTEAARAVGALVLDGLRESAPAPTRVLLAADGVLHRVPWALLLEAAGPPLDRSEVSVVPSATILVDLRRRRAPPGAPPERRSDRGGIAVVEEPVTTEGTRLAGVEREVRELRRRYESVTVLTREAASDPSRWMAGAPGVLHVAAHSVIDDERPWRSGIHLRAAEGAVGETGSLLRAESIVGRPVSAPLVVLSSCTSAGGRARTGDGVEGLAAAFLTGGAEAVVATLWPVEDRAAARFMGAFYEELARGRSVAGALGAAQEAVRATEPGGDPFFWAGYVVLGDGAIEVPLRRRPWLARLAPGTVGMALLLLAVAAILSRRRSVSA
jgi:tetratricopeptide (TPR) repeat protein